MNACYFSAYCRTDQICPTFKHRRFQSHERQDQTGDFVLCTDLLFWKCMSREVTITLITAQHIKIAIKCYIHTYMFNNPRSQETIQDTKTVSDEIEKEPKENLTTVHTGV